MAKVILVAGLPGSGKTRYLERLGAGGIRTFDDFKAKARDDSPLFEHSRFFGALLEALRGGAVCAVADIDFCRSAARDDAEMTLRRFVPEVEVEWRFFEDNEAGCRANIEAGRRSALPEDLAKLNEFARGYCIPADSTVLPVWRRS